MKNIFDKTHPNGYVGLRDFIHAFFTALYRNKTATRTQREAWGKLSLVFDDVKKHVIEHNDRFTPSERSVWHYDEIKVPPYSDFSRLYTFPGQYIPKNLVIMYTCTTNQYILIASNGAMELHQQIESVYMKHEPEVYQHNKLKSLLFSLPGFDGKTVWGVVSKKKQNFLGYAKSGTITA